MVDKAMGKLAELEDGHIWQKLYGKCDVCQEIKPVSELMIQVSFPEVEMDEEYGKYITRVKKIPPLLTCRFHE